MTLLKNLAGRLPEKWQNELKRHYFGRQIAANTFFTDEHEYSLLETWVKSGDWVIDIGANIGHYSARLSTLVGLKGRVIAFEPVPGTFELLIANICRLPTKNITALNLAVSCDTQLIGMKVPEFDSGLKNFYMAYLTEEDFDFSVMTISIDSLDIPSRVSLVKIDAEGSEMDVLSGMTNLIRRDCPVLIIEDSSPKISSYLSDFGYTWQQLKNSSNRIYEPGASVRKQTSE